MSKLRGKITVKEVNDQLQITVLSFSSSDITVQLSSFNNLDWRASVMHVEIDLDYNNENFNPDIIDQPTTAIDYVKGEYKTAKNRTGTQIAVRITDILGNSLILTKTIH